ncbi:MAG TPA: riboflavin synthase [Alphaproteobacteria bacterium]|jgi:riboflavin synthase|nr:riboflavin synthase [Alphaproteobacteria bacterium]|tara:strand:+ start:1035 stop:1622 length:588 start_codon:yes stop_codon:yes gene_type:complete
MFTGIVSDIGIVDNINSHGDIVIDVKTKLANLKTKVGDSISCSGICLSIIKKKKTILSFQSSVETTNRTTIKDWFVGGKINLERSLKFGGEMGGHMIAGHVDGIAKVSDIIQKKESKIIICKTQKRLMSMIAEKGSVALDGVSLTVNWVGRDGFSVNIISHTRKNTTLDSVSKGSKLNLEVDIFAKYIAQAMKEK